MKPRVSPTLYVASATPARFTDTLGAVLSIVTVEPPVTAVATVCFGEVVVSSVNVIVKSNASWLSPPTTV